MPVEQPRSQQRHERILEAALQVFTRKGYRDSAVDDIAAESRTSKGGVYFHFPNKQAIFLALLERMSALLRSRVETAIAAQTEPVARAEAALQTVLETFASHRTLARLFLVEALGAGREFHERMVEVRASFAALIQRHLDDAVRQGVIPQLDTATASRVWFGALDEVVSAWALAENPGRLEDAYPVLRALLLRGIGVRHGDDIWPGSPLVARRPPADAGLDLDAPRLRPLFQEGLRRAREDHRPILVSAVARVPWRDPLLLYERGARAATVGAAERMFWSAPHEEYVLAGVGCAWGRQVASSGFRVPGSKAESASAGELPAQPAGGRYEECAKAWRELCAGAVVSPAPGVLGTGPLAMAGFSFDPLRPSTPPWDGYPAALLVLPRCLITLVDGACWLTVNAVIWPDGDAEAEADQAARLIAELTAEESVEDSGATEGELRVAEVMPAGQWKRIVGSLVEEMGKEEVEGRLEKVVLARECRIQGSVPFSPARVLRRLRADYPGCFTFAVARGDRCFLGATPERLVRLRHGTIWTSCLAGSIGRGATAEEDQRLGQALLASPKERSEQAIVVRALYDSLAPLCEDLTPPGEPTVMKMRNLQHLYTPVVGRVAGGRTILELVEALHPTPAVGGSPRDLALPLIREREELDRGWYAGPLGWLDARAEGEFAVAIRSALLAGSEASLFAGCGIVAGSDPRREYEESCLKLRPILAALGGRT